METGTTLAQLAKTAHSTYWRIKNEQDKKAARIARYFGDSRPTDITPETLEAYQAYRSNDGATNSDIDTECELIHIVLASRDLWSESFIDHYRPIGRALDENAPMLSGEYGPRAEARIKQFIDAASSNPAWILTALIARLMLGTGLDMDEARTLRLSDIDTELQSIRVRQYANIPARDVRVSADAREALSELLKRAYELGSSDRNHCLFPFSKNKQQYDPTRPMTFHTFTREVNNISRAAEVDSIGGPFLQRMTYAARVQAGLIKPEAKQNSFESRARELAHNYVPPAMTTEPEPEPPPVPTQRTMQKPTHSAVAAVDSAIGKGMVSVAAMIKRLQKAGVPAETILKVLTESEEQ